MTRPVGSGATPRTDRRRGPGRRRAHPATRGPLPRDKPTTPNTGQAETHTGNHRQNKTQGIGTLYASPMSTHTANDRDMATYNRGVITGLNAALHFLNVADGDAAATRENIQWLLAKTEQDMSNNARADEPGAK